MSCRLRHNNFHCSCLVFQGLTIWAFCSEDGKLNLHVRTIKKIMSVGPTFVVMKFIQCEFSLLPLLDGNIVENF